MVRTVRWIRSSARSWGWRSGFVILALGAAIATGWQTADDQSLSRVRAAGMIRIGYAIEAPYAYLDATGSVTGESPEVARGVVALAGLGRIVWQQMEFGDLLPELEAGRIDVVAAGMFITDDRRRQVAFSSPTFHVHPALLVAAGNPRGLRGGKDAVARADIRIAALAGAVEETLLRHWGAAPPRLVLVPDALTGRHAVTSGLVDALILSAPTVRWMAAHDHQGLTEALMVTDDDGGTASDRYGRGGFAFRTDDQALKAAWDEALAVYRASGSYSELMARLGFSPAEYR